ncbi:MAG: hypothetical protein ABH858_05025 [Candidatus Omnitrophota bacterium]
MFEGGKYKTGLVVLMVVSFFIPGVKEQIVDYFRKEAVIKQKGQDLEEKMTINNILIGVNKEIDKFEIKPFAGDIFDFKKFIEDTAEKTGIVIDTLNRGGERPKIKRRLSIW